MRGLSAATNARNLRYRGNNAMPDTSIAGPSSPLHLPRGTVLFRPEQECAGFVVVSSGTVRVSLTAENGREIVLYRVRPGDVCLQTFGCLVNGRPYSAEGVAETDIAIEIVPASRFQQRVIDDADFRNALFSAVAARFADLERLVEDIALSSLEARLARALLRLADDTGTINATHEAIAVEIGSGRAAVSRQLAILARRGIVEPTRGAIRVADPHSLHAIAADAD